MGDMGSKSVTPMRRQYLAIKKQYPDTVVLFRLGDFYETFDDDAKIISQVCDVVLTSRPAGKNTRVPLAGVPYHSVDGHIAKLVNAGYKVAIAEQQGNQAVNGLVPRDVRRVVTPGTLVEPSLLDERRNNYLVALAWEGERAGLAYADISTGEFATTEWNEPDALARLNGELDRLEPAELLVTEAADPETLLPDMKNGETRGWTVSTRPDWQFDEETAAETLKEHFDVASLEGFGCAGLPMATRTAGALLRYLMETQKEMLRQVVGLRSYTTAEYMMLDEATRRNLELMRTMRGSAAEGSLLGVLDQTRTPMGARLLRRWLAQPLLDMERLNQRLDSVGLWTQDTPRRLELRELLKQTGDLERMINRVVGGSALPRDLVGVQRGLEQVPLVRALAGEVGHDMGDLDDCDDVVSLIGAAIADDPPANLTNGGVIRSGYSADLDTVQSASSEAKEWVANLQRRERNRTGIKSLKVGYNKVFGYYLEVTNTHQKSVPSDYIRKQTLVSSERYITPELKEVESRILNAEERILDLEAQLFKQVCDQISAAASRVQATAQALAQLDVVSDLAEVAVNHRYVRPELAEDDRIDVVAGRHPVVEVTQRHEPFVDNDIHLSADEQVIILTGPNMAGKSTYLRQVALTVLMAQIGSFIPADSAHIGLVDRIFTRIGAQDEISAGKSTFMVEMVEAANILHHATSRSLLILDEIGRGTSTYDGMSIAWAVVEHIHNHPKLQARTLFATHYHELTELATALPRVRNYNVSVREKEGHVVFLRKIVPGGADRSYGIHVARLAGLPRTVIQRAEEVLAELERNRSAKSRRAISPPPLQLTFFDGGSEVEEELASMDVISMTPLEALNKLYELAEKAQSRSSSDRNTGSPTA